MQQIGEVYTWSGAVGCVSPCMLTSGIINSVNCCTASEEYHASPSAFSLFCRSLEDKVRINGKLIACFVLVK